MVYNISVINYLLSTYFKWGTEDTEINQSEELPPEALSEGEMQKQIILIQYHTCKPQPYE